MVASSEDHQRVAAEGRRAACFLPAGQVAEELGAISAIAIPGASSTFRPALVVAMPST